VGWQINALPLTASSRESAGRAILYRAVEALGTGVGNLAGVDMPPDGGRGTSPPPGIHRETGLTRIPADAGSLEVEVGTYT
jgi:hypothetical protein